MRLFQEMPTNRLTVRRRILPCNARSNQLARQLAFHVREFLANFDKYNANPHGENGPLIVTIFNKYSRHQCRNACTLVVAWTSSVAELEQGTTAKASGGNSVDSAAGVID